MVFIIFQGRTVQLRIAVRFQCWLFGGCKKPKEAWHEIYWIHIICITVYRHLAGCWKPDSMGINWKRSSCVILGWETFMYIRGCLPFSSGLSLKQGSSCWNVSLLIWYCIRKLHYTTLYCIILHYAICHSTCIYTHPKTIQCPIKREPFHKESRELPCLPWPSG